MTMLSFRVSEADAAETQLWAERLGVQQSELLRQALHRHLVRLRSEDDAATWEAMPATDEELALSAADEWGPAEDWSDWADASG